MLVGELISPSERFRSQNSVFPAGGQSQVLCSIRFGWICGAQLLRWRSEIEISMPVVPQIAFLRFLSLR